LVINKLLLLHLVGSSYFTYIDDALSNTNLVYAVCIDPTF